MAKARLAAGLMVGCLVGALAAPATAAPTVAQMLSFRPRQEGVNYATPTTTEQEACKVQLVTGDRPGANGWLLRDARGLPLRRFFDTNGDKQIDVWSYYKDGVEVYREMDSNFNGKVDQYRWLNANGMKWGIDEDEDGKIDHWKIISAEEVSQEVLQAVIAKDFDRLKALFITDKEMEALGLSANEVRRIHTLQQQAPTKFRDTCAKAGLDDKAHWERLECHVPQCVPAEQVGMKHDIIKQSRGTIMYENGGKHDWLQTGEMVQVGLAWRLVDVPAPGDTVPDGSLVGGAQPLDPAMNALLEELRVLDNAAPKTQDGTGPNPAVVTYNLKRAAVLLKIAGKAKTEEYEQWMRQVIDCYGTAAQASADTERTAYEALVELEKQIVAEKPGTSLAAYATFREMSADYSRKLANTPSKDFTKVQEQWLDRLARFVQAYPKADDTPDALIQLGMVSEFVNKEIEAKNWYGQLVKNFPDHALSAKARGAVRRLELEGKPLELAGKTMEGNAFDITALYGKVVVVYYWASWNQQCVGDFAKLKLLMQTYRPKGVELVCVNLDNSPPEASDFMSRTPTAGIHLYHPGGLDSPLAAQYGIMVLPNMFLVGKDGKVTSRTVQVGTLEDELKKLLK